MKINNISNFTQALADLSAQKEFQLYFRGHSNADKYKLKPTLYREGKSYFKSEHLLYRDTILNCPNDFKSSDKTIDELVKMQHYGVPTRILDVTKNALVALYFACLENEEEDGEVIILKIPNRDVCYYDSDRVTILSNLAKVELNRVKYDIPEDFISLDRKAIKKINKRHFGYLLHSIKEDKPHFFDIINPEDLEKVYAVQVKLDNPRIVRQSGAFLIFGIVKDKSKSPEIKETWVVKPKGEKIIIPPESKQNIIKELEVLGISKSTLFPELDDFADYIKEKYLE